MNMNMKYEFIIRELKLHEVTTLKTFKWLKKTFYLKIVRNILRIVPSQNIAKKL